jgi:hypothetical protein
MTSNFEENANSPCESADPGPQKNAPGGPASNAGQLPGEIELRVLFAVSHDAQKHQEEIDKVQVKFQGA